MPNYEYLCAKCSNVQEENHSILVKPKIICKNCDNICEKQFSPTTNFILKGDGWPSHNARQKKEMLEKNNKMKKKMEERTKCGESVTTLGQLKTKLKT